MNIFYNKQFNYKKISVIIVFVYFCLGVQATQPSFDGIDVSHHQGKIDWKNPGKSPTCIVVGIL